MCVRLAACLLVLGRLANIIKILGGVINQAGKGLIFPVVLAISLITRCCLLNG